MQFSPKGGINAVFKAKAAHILLILMVSTQFNHNFKSHSALVSMQFLKAMVLT